MESVDVIIGLPVWKQGDDLANCVEEDEHPSKAFMCLAEKYIQAADVCRKVAEIIEHEDCTLSTDTHMILVGDVSKGVADKLVEFDYGRVIDWSE